MKDRLISTRVSFSIWLCLTAAVCGVVAVWYPRPYGTVLGVQKVALLMVVLDFIIGPILALLTWRASKGLTERRFDFAVLLAIRISVFLFGFYFLYMGRPVYTAFEVDRFRIVTSAEIYSPPDTPFAKFDWKSIIGPRVIGTRPPVDSAEKLYSIEMSMHGIEPGMMSNWWQSVELNKLQITTRARPISQLKNDAETQKSLQDTIKNCGCNINDLGWLPLVTGKRSDWVVLLDINRLSIVDFINVDGFY